MVKDKLEFNCDEEITEFVRNYVIKNTGVFGEKESIIRGEKLKEVLKEIDYYDK